MAIEDDNLHFDREQGVDVDANSVDNSAGNMDNVPTLASGKVGDTDGDTMIIGTKRIDVSDSRAVQQEIDDFAKMYANADVEYARVITQSGDVFTLQGTESTVNPAIVGSDALHGATVMHNHPVEAGERMGDSFSRVDLEFAARHQTGAHYLFSGERQDSFAFTTPMSEDEVYNAWQDAESKMLRRAKEGILSAHHYQAGILAILNEDQERFDYYDSI